MGTALCQRCRDMFSKEGLPDLLNMTGFRHSFLSSFAERPTCVFCSYMWNDHVMVRTRPPTDNPLTWLREVLVCQKDFDPTTSTVCFHMAIHEYTKIEGSFAVLSFWVDPQGDGEIHVDFGDRLLVGAPEGDPLASFTDHRPLRWEGLSEDFGSAARARLAECEHSHVACKPSGPAPLPTRVLRIIPQQSSSWPRVRLFVPPRDGPLRRYACLSYCWGGEQDVKLTKANIHALQTNDLDMVTLPLTLRDAIMTAQCLGISYLWIDALCIVQDDEDDKQRELAHMGSIYSRCAVCISAATGESVHDGFLKPAHRPNKLRPMCRITLPPSLNDEFHGILILSPFQFQESEEFAINKRGWTYQEALLAPRTLMFGDIEPLLRCRTEDAIQIHYSGFMYYSDPLSPHIVTNTNVNHYAVEKIKDMYLAMWPDLVSQYTRRRLTVDRDKPVAIQGVIDFLAQKMDDKCYHGIWASSPSTLLWTSSESISIERGASIRNPSVPTWSWMCVAGTNRIVEAAEIIKGSLEAKVRFEASDGSPSVCSRLHVTCRILTAAEVKRAHAFMNFEPDIPLDWASETDLQWLARNELRNKLRDILPEKNIGKLPLVTYEILSHLYWMIAESEQGLYILVVCKRSPDTGLTARWRGCMYKNIMGILVERVGGNVYKRIGLVEVQSLKRWWRCRSKAIVI
ncbi:hypothetical protein RB601_000009 [Gaeumannomyces tritici]